MAVSRSHYSSDEVCRLLDILPETLYAYVSRGLVRSEPGSTARGRLYRRSDIEALQQRRELRRRPQQVLRKSLDWGAPILDSALTLIADGRLYYRGKNVLRLANEMSLRDVALEFWTGHGKTKEPKVTLPPLAKHLRLAGNRLGPLGIFQAWLPVLNETDPAAGAKDVTLSLRSAARLVLSLASVTAGSPIGSLDEIAPSVGRNWNRTNPRDWRLIEQALILCIDHELNISSFTARCVASAGSNLYEVVNAALSAFYGFRHGGSTTRLEGLFDEVTKQKHPRKIVVARISRGEEMPGFGHPLYASGDPRAQFILSALHDRYPHNGDVRCAFEIIKAARDILGREPNIDFALVTLRRALRAPLGAAITLFALGRSIGWTSHAMEQYQMAQLVRPRARYIGPPPETAL